MTSYTTITTPGGTTTYTDIASGSIPYDNTYTYDTALVTYDGFLSSYTTITTPISTTTYTTITNPTS